MKHYVCTGDCVGVSNKPGVCETEGCDHEGKGLIQCHCDDEMHDEAFNKAGDAPLSTVGIPLEGDEEEPSDDDLMTIDEEEEETI
jgi:hypothetical protein